MNRPTLPMLALAVSIAGCASLPENYAPLEQARSAYRVAAADSQVASLAGPELNRAEVTLRQAEALHRDGADPGVVDHQSYLAVQRARIAQETAALRVAERSVAEVGEERNKLLLAARTREADVAHQQVGQQTRATEIAQQQQAQQARAAESAREVAVVQSARADAAQRQAAEFETRTRLLEAELENAKTQQTERGYVVTLGSDLLFDIGKAELKPGAERAMTKLAAFLREHPKRNIAIEGFTDSTGSDDLNQDLSERRARAVAYALRTSGVEAGRLATRGHGESYPVATNDTPAGRQLNRRVEVVLIEESGRAGLKR